MEQILMHKAGNGKNRIEQTNEKAQSMFQGSTIKQKIIDYNKENQEVTDIEGSMFLYRRSHPPYHGFVIMNRMNTTNQVEPFVAGLDFQVKKPYLLYKNKSDDIYGTWFYEQGDFIRMTSNIQRIIHAMCMRARPRRQRCFSESESQRSPSKMASTSTDIVTLLAHAQLEYEKKNISVTANNGTTESSKDYNILSLCSEKRITDKNLLAGEKLHSKANKVTDVEDNHPRRRFLSCKGSASFPADCPHDSSEQVLFQSALHSPNDGRTTLGITNRANEARYFRQNEPITDGSHLSKCSSDFPDLPEIWPDKASLMMTPRMFQEISSPNSNSVELGSSPTMSGICSLEDSFASIDYLPVTPVKPQHILAKSFFSPDILHEKSISGGHDSFQTKNSSKDNTVYFKQDISKNSIVESFIHLLKNDSSILFKIHKGYISSLQTHIRQHNK